MANAGVYPQPKVWKNHRRQKASGRPL